DDEKMSSSLGNFETVAEAVEKYGPNVVRTFLLSTAYHSPATYSPETVSEAQSRWKRLERGYDRTRDAVDSVDARTKVEDGDLREAVDDARAAFESAMDDDFNTRGALTALRELTGAVNAHLDDREEYDYRGLRRVLETYEELGGGVLGLAFGGVAEGEAGLASEVVELVLSIREEEREAGNYERADQLRDDLEALGIEVQDTDDGPEFHLG
ncbi:MAG: DALR domain-containing protein, partial [Haloferacaceae archaeon]